MTVMVWGGGATDDLAERIRTGDVAIDLYRPVPLIGWYARPGPRPRGVPPARPRCRADGRRRAALRHPLPAARPALAGVRGQPPAGGAGELRDPVPRRQHGLLAARRRPGPQRSPSCWRSFFSGLTVPLVIFPGWTADVVMALPWASYLQIPADIWLGKRAAGSSSAGLALQARLGRRAARRLLAGAAAGDPQGGGPGWLRPTVVSAALSRLPRHRGDVDPRRAGLPRVVLDDGGQRLRRSARSTSSGIWIMFHTIDSLGGFDLLGDRLPVRRHRASGSRVADLVVGPRRAARPADPDGPPRRDDGQAAAAAGPGVRRRVRAARLARVCQAVVVLGVACTYVTTGRRRRSW